jgi:hypothetical protein
VANIGNGRTDQCSLVIHGLDFNSGRGRAAGVVQNGRRKGRCRPQRLQRCKEKPGVRGRMRTLEPCDLPK